MGGEEIGVNFRKILVHSIKHGGLDIPDPWLSVEIVYNTSKVDSRELLDSLLVNTGLNYVGHSSCVRRASVGARKERKHIDMAELAIKFFWWEAKRGTASTGQRLKGHGLALYPIVLMARICLGMNSGIIFASDMG